jgi:CO/xanthine dehydrogenase FAD-binding subunit
LIKIRQAADREAPPNVRQRATIGGTVALGDAGPLLACLLALDAQVVVEPGTRRFSLDVYLAERRAGRMDDGLIVAVSFEARRRVGYAEIARTPADLPVMFVTAGAEVTGGRLVKVQVACGGTHQPLVSAPEVARRLEGLRTADAGEAASAAGAELQVAWADDIRGHATYRRAMQPELLRRAVTDLVAKS